MKTIYKYEITAGFNSIDMPYDAEILRIGTQGDKPQLWALVDTEHPNEARKFYPFGTGWNIEETLKKVNPHLNLDKYIGTFEISAFGLVFHLFEVK